jgi:hypothetical protein
MTQHESSAARKVMFWHNPTDAKTGVELSRVVDPPSTPAIPAEPSFRQSNQYMENFMRLSPEVHVHHPHPSQPAMFGMLKPPPKPLTRPRTPVLQATIDPARCRLEYENPDLTRPSVSSF